MTPDERELLIRVLARLLFVQGGTDEDAKKQELEAMTDVELYAYAQGVLTGLPGTSLH